MLAVQASGPPVRVPNGLKGNRLSLILAVLSKHARMPLYKVPAPAPAGFCDTVAWSVPAHAHAIGYECNMA